jgi:hypothetical protein
MKYIFNRLSKNNIELLIPLFKNAFGYLPNLKDFFQSYNTDYLGCSDIGYLAFDESVNAVSFYGIFPVKAKVNKNIILLGQSGNTMTHQDHVGQGLFISTAELTFSLCVENGIAGVFGFPLKSAFPTLKKKLMWEFNEKINNYSFIIPTLPLGIISRKIKRFDFFYKYWVKFILSFYPKGDIFESSILSNGQDGLIRQIEVWDHKLGIQENFLIKINGKNIVLKFNGQICIGDIEHCDENVFFNIIFKLKVLSFLTFNNYLKFYVSPYTFLDDNLMKIKKPKVGLPVGFRSFSKNIDLSNLKFTFFDFDTF